MRAIRPGADVPDGSAAAAPADPLAAAAELRWSRPDLTAALADHVLESSAAADDRDRWLAAAGWAVHARSATGDGRDTAADVIGCLPDWGPGVLDGPAAGRLRVELALVAVNAEETAVAAALLEPVVAEEGPAELRGDAFGVLARCAVDEAPDQVEAALACAERAWEELGSPQRELGGAAVALVAAAAHRRSGRAPLAAERAADGLAELERARQGAGSGPRSGHLAAALAAEWILSLLDAGDAEQARQGCAELAPRLEHSRPSRQLARLRLAVARTNAVGSTAAETAAHTLGQAVRDAAECDAPDLEALCCSALGAVYEKAGRPDFALTTVERGVAAQRRDRSRADRFRAALATLPVRVAPASSERPDPADTTRPLPVGPVAGEPVTALLPTTGRVGAEAARSGAPARERSRHGLAVDRAWRLGEYAETADDASPSRHTDGETRPDRDRGPERPTTARPEPSTRPDLAQADQRPGGRSGVWDVDWDETDQSPIGDSLMRSMRDTRHDRPSQPAGERRTAAPSSAESAPPARTRRAEPTGSPDAARTELLRVTEADSAPAHDGPEPQDPAPGTAAASRHRLDTGMNPVVPTRPRTAAEELDAHRTAARRKEQAPSAFSAEWLAAELADLERIWERISQPAVRPETSSDAAPGATAGDAAGGASAAPVDEDRADEHDTEHDAEYDPADPADRADRADADADRAGSGRRRADRSGANGSGANGSGVNGSTPGRAPRGRRRSADLGDSEPDGAVAGTAGASRARDERDAADPTAPAGGGRARSGSAARSGVAAELTRPADGTESHSTSDSTGGSPGSSNGTTAEGVATAWTMTRPAGRRRRAEPEVGSDGPADAEDEQTGRRSSGARSAPGSASRGAPRTGRRRADADDPAEAGSGRADAAEDETTAAGGAQDPRDRPDGRGADRAGRRRADPMTAADGAPSANGHSANGHSANGRSAGNPVAEKTGGSGRGARQAANARAETAMFPAVRPEPASAADAALFGPLPAELLEPVLAEPATAPAAPAEPTSPPPPKAARRDADGCVVGIDIAREGRRLVGRRSAEVLRTVAEVLRGSLPPEGRIDEDEPGVLRVSAPGWGRGAATGWMRSRLPGVLDGFAVEVDPSGMNLRAAVRDADGPVGAQLLQRLDPPGGDALGGEVPGGKVPGAATPGGASRRGAGTGPPLARPAGPGGGRRRADDRPEPERAAPQAFTRPVAGRHGSGETGVMASVDPGRHEQDAAPPAGAAAGARPDPGKGAAAPRGRRRAAETPAGGADPQEPKGDEQDPPAGGAPARKRVDASTEGLGLADLLAGALAEYRGI